MTPTNPDDARYTLTELADLAGVTPRTVRYYLAQGLLPAVGVAGPGAKYDDTHLARLRLIKRLQREHQPLAEIRRRLDTLDDAEVIALTEPSVGPPPDSAVEYLRRVMAPTRAREERALYAMPRLMTEPASTTPVADATPMPEAPPRVERSQWERIVLAPDIELHIRRPLPRSTAKQVDRLVSIARDLLEEELP